MITSKDLAKMLNVSQSTVSRALNDSPLLSEETKKYIQKAAAEQGFVLNSQARSLKNKKTGTIGILFPKYFESLIGNLMLTHIYDKLQKELRKIDYDVMVVNDINGGEDRDVLERIVKSRKVDGFVNFHSMLTKSELQLIDKYDSACVSIFCAHQENPRLCQFRMDEFSTGRRAGEYFGKQKEYKSVYVSLPLSQENSSARYKGYCQGLKDQGADICKVITCELAMRSAYEAVLAEKDWFRDNKAAVYVYNDVLALGVVRAIQNIGLKIPEQIQVIGTDDLPMASWLPPELSTLHAPIEEIVEEGCKALKRQLDGERIINCVKLYPSELIHRETTLGDIG